jgi:hypothetical protein
MTVSILEAFWRAAFPCPRSPTQSGQFLQESRIGQIRGSCAGVPRSHRATRHFPIFRVRQDGFVLRPRTLRVPPCATLTRHRPRRGHIDEGHGARTCLCTYGLSSIVRYSQSLIEFSLEWANGNRFLPFGKTSGGRSPEQAMRCCLTAACPRFCSTILPRALPAVRRTYPKQALSWGCHLAGQNWPHG